jgi:hypothetical protein
MVIVPTATRPTSGRGLRTLTGRDAHADTRTAVPQTTANPIAFFST